jgi:hypothetical protein
MWNELLRPYVGGPEAPAELEAAAAAPSPPRAPAPAPAVAPAPAPGRPAPVQFTTHRPDVPAAAHAAPAPTAPSVAYPAPAPRPAAPPAVRTWYPPKPPQSQRPTGFQHQPPQHYSSGEDESDSVQVEPSADPATLYSRLADIPGRRSERDGVLAAVWFLTRGERETSADEVEAHFASLQAFPDVKVVPLLLKHVHRTKTLEQGSSPRAVRLTAKGITAVRGRLVPV